MKSQYLTLNRFVYILFALNLITFANAVSAFSQLTDTVDIHCAQDHEQLHCDYRTLLVGQPVSLSVSHNETVFPTINEAIHADQTLTTAILFLVDVSDPARQNVIDQNKAHIQTLLGSTNHDYQFGLAVFDKTMRIHSSVDQPLSSLHTALTNLKAEGYTTEFYRGLLKAIDYLATVDAARKVIIVFSDGQAEDQAYFHTDVVKAARQSRIIVNSIGYPRSLALSVALQTLRRISEETGGIYKETNIHYQLPKADIRQLLDNIKQSHSVSFDLTNNPSETIALTIQAATASQTFSIPVKVHIKPVADPIQTTPQPLIQTPPALSPAETLATTQPRNTLLWHGLPMILITIAIVLLFILFLIWRQNSKAASDAVSAPAKNDDKAYAYLIIENDPAMPRHPITSLIWRIGRSGNNELKIDDVSISRQHAEIHKNHDGTFDIVDTNSKNGVYINNEQIKNAILNEGDVIEIGDIVLRFTQFPEDHAVEETVMQKTKAPI